MSIFLLLFLVAIYLANTLGMSPDGGYIFWWYDIPMHIAGGAWVAAAFIYLTCKYEWIGRIVRPTISSVLGAVLFVGIGWEIFEYAMDVFVFGKYAFLTWPRHIMIDAGYDLINNLLGATIAWWFLRKRKLPVPELQ